MPIEEAVEKATTECIREDILREFLEKNQAEAIAMSIYEYNYEEHMRMEREGSYADGLLEGKLEGKNESINLILRMMQDGLQDSIMRLASDSEYYKKMTEKYLLKD